MKFSDIFYEKFTHKFSARNFDDGVITKVSIPNDIEYDRIEVYAHSSDTIYVFTFLNKSKGIHSMWRGTFDNPIKSIRSMEIYDGNLSHTSYELLHPNSPTSSFEYSGVEPLNPNEVFTNYHGTTHIPKQFNMPNGFSDEPISGIRTSKNWTKN